MEPTKEKDDLDRILKEWNPMEAEYRSVLNYGFAYSYLTPALVIGGIDAEGEYASIRQVPCEFNDGRGSCFKGRYCVKYHPIGTEAVGPAINQATTYSVKDLPLRSNHLPEPDIQFHGIVCYVNSPIDFYVIPNENYICMCGCGRRPHYYEGCSIPLTGIKGLEYFDEELDRFMDTKKRNFQLPTYKKGQLVMVQVANVELMNTPMFSWYRAVVEADMNPIKDVYALRYVNVQLLDFGPKMTVPLDRVTSLPLKFLHISPLGYRCQLHNFLSVGPSFSTEATERFKSMVKGQELIIWYRSGYFESHEAFNSPNRGRFDPQLVHSVELRVKETKQRIGPKLSQEGYGLILHPFPRRPGLWANQGLSLAGASLLAPEKYVPVPPYSFDFFGATMDNERRRLFAMVNRMDGFFDTPLETWTYEMRMYLKFKKEYATPGVPLLPEMGFTLPDRTIPVADLEPKAPPRVKKPAAQGKRPGSPTLVGDPTAILKSLIKGLTLKTETS